MDEEVLMVKQFVGDLVAAEADAEEPARQIYNPSDPFATMTDTQFIGFFRVSKALVQEIIQMLTPYMYQGRNYCSLEIQTKVKSLKKLLITVALFSSFVIGLVNITFLYFRFL